MWRQVFEASNGLRGGRGVGNFPSHASSPHFCVPVCWLITMRKLNTSNYKGRKIATPLKKNHTRPGCFRRLLLLMLDHWTSRGEPLVEMFPCSGLFELVWIPDESLLLKTKKCLLYFFNSWLLSPVKHSFLANALLNYSIPPWEDYCSLCSTWQAV